MAFSRVSLLVLAACFGTGQALVRASSQEDSDFWPFTSWSQPPPARKSKPVALVKHHVEHRPTAPPAARSLAEIKEETTSTSKFNDKVAMLCKDAKQGEDSHKCTSVMGERMWCGLFARNIQEFLYVKGLKEQRVRCNEVNAMKGSEWFVGEGAWILKPVREVRGGSFMG